MDEPGAACGGAWELVKGLIRVRPWVALLVDANVRLLIANDAGNELIRSGNGWAMGSSGEIRHVDAQITRELHTRVGQLVLASGRAEARTAFFIEQPDGQQLLLTMSLVQTGSPHCAAASCAAHTPVVLVTMIQGHRREMRQGCDLLIETFDLTPAEARVAVALLEGASLQTYSQQARIRISTVRWHLRNALAKTGCASQRELVRLLIALLDT